LSIVRIFIPLLCGNLKKKKKKKSTLTQFIKLNKPN